MFGVKKGKIYSILAILAVGTTLPSVAHAEDLSELRQQMEVLLQRVNELEAKERANKAKLAKVEKVTKASFRPTTRKDGIVKTRRKTSPDEIDELTGKLFAIGDTIIEIGGFTKLDLIYDVDESTGDLLVPQAISVLADNDENRFGAHAKESRLFIKAATPVNLGSIRAHIEGDFFSGTGNEIVTNGFGFRLRHAYGEINTKHHNVLAGQFWSAFVPIEAYPSTVDFGGPAGNSFLRQAQLRYTYKPTDKLSFVASLENSETTFRTGALEAGAGVNAESTNFGLRAGLDTIPDFVFSALYRGDRGLVKGAVLLRELNAPNSSSSEFGYGLQLSGRYKLTDKFEAIGSALYGEGVGRYVFNGIGQGGFVSNFTGTGTGIANGDIEAIETASGYLKLNYKVSDEVTLAAVYGHYEILDTFTDLDTERLQTVHGSVYYKPFEDITIGGEVSYARRELANGLDDDLVRFQASVKYQF